MAGWKNTLDLGVVHYMSYLDTIEGKGPIVDNLEQCLNDSDFTVIDITHIEDFNARKRVAEILRHFGIRVIFSAIPPMVFNEYNLSTLDSDLRKSAVSRGKELIDEALSLGAETVFFISGPDPDPQKREQAYSALYSSMKSLCSYARTKSTHKELVVALEPADRAVQHKQLLGPFSETSVFAKEVRRDYDNFGLVVDQSHIQQLNEQPESVFTQCAGFVCHIHLANAVVDDSTHPLYGDQHPPFGIPGSRVSVLDLSRFIQTALNHTLWDGNRRPSMSLEVKPRSEENPWDVITKAKIDFINAWDMYRTRSSNGNQFEKR